MVPGCTLQANLHCLSPQQNALKNRLTLPASGMVDIVPKIFFGILIGNLSTKLTSIPCHMFVPVGNDLLEMFIHFQLGETPPWTKKVAVYHLKKREIKNWSHRLEPSEKKGRYSVCRRSRHTFEKLKDKVPAVYYHKEESKELQGDRHKNVETIDSEVLQKDWGEQVNASQSYDRYRQDILEMLQEFQHLWDGRPGRIRMAKYCIKITLPDIRPINSAP